MRRLAFLLVASLVGTVAHAVQPKAYEPGSWPALVKPYAGRNVIVHFWGVTCAPCLKELPKWGDLVAGRKGRDVLFVEMDPVAPASFDTLVEKSRLAQAPHWLLAGPFDEQVRYEIDPKWQGELPFTVLIDKKGAVKRISGPVDFDELKRFLAP